MKSSRLMPGLRRNSRISLSIAASPMPAQPGRRRTPLPAGGGLLADLVGGELVAVEVTGIGEIAAREALARRAFAAAAELEDLGVERVDLLPGIHREAIHRAVADGCRLLVVRAEHAEHMIRAAIDPAARRMVGDCRHADRLHQRVVE